MVQVHTVYDRSAWRNLVDGLQQGVATANRSAAVAQGRAIARDFGCTHDVHDVDGRVVEHQDYGALVPTPWPGAVRYTGAIRYTA